MSVRSFWSAFLTTWRYHAGVQLATLVVLVATFSVVATFLSIGLNLHGIMSHWGQEAQISAYLKDGIVESKLAEAQEFLEETGSFSNIKFVSKPEALEKFRQQMSSFAPDLLDDPEFAATVPASFELSVNGNDVAEALRAAVEKIQGNEAFEHVSYGQDWVDNYAALGRGLGRIGIAIAIVLIAGSFLVIGNSIRTSVVQRRDEIQILDLVGATTAMIQAPFIFEGLLMGLISGGLALMVTYFFHYWGLELLGSGLDFLKLGPRLDFLSASWCFFVLILAAVSGAFGSYVSIRRVSNEWVEAEK